MKLNKGNYKIKIKNEKESKAVQEALFKQGCKWRGDNSPEIQYTKDPCLYVNFGDIARGNSAEYFEDDSGNEIFVKDILVGYKTKTPTHLVVWEEDEDPCEFFTSEEEAKTFIKELSEKPEVQKESIILVEIKSIRKVQIQKSLRYAQHKI